MIAIQLVRCNGRLVGRRAEDRWNLALLGINSIEPSRNHGALKRVRRMHGDFTFEVKRGNIAYDSLETSWDWQGAHTSLSAAAFEFAWLDAFAAGFDVARDAA